MCRHFQQGSFLWLTAMAILVALALPIAPMANAQEIENLKPLDSSDINLEAEIRVETSDITSRDIDEVREEALIMRDSDDPYAYFSNLSSEEQRAIIAGIERSELPGFPPQLAPFTTRQSNPYRIYI